MNDRICQVCGLPKPVEEFSKIQPLRCCECVDKINKIQQNIYLANSVIQPKRDELPPDLLEELKKELDWEARRYDLAVSLFRESIRTNGWVNAKEAAADAIETATIFINTIKKQPL